MTMSPWRSRRSRGWRLARHVSRRSRGRSRPLCLLEPLEPRQLLATYIWEPKNDGGSIAAWSATNTGDWLPVTVVYPNNNQWTAPRHVSETAFSSPPLRVTTGIGPGNPLYDPSYEIPGPAVVDQPGNWSLPDYPDTTDADVVIGAGNSVILAGYVNFPYPGSPSLSGEIEIDTLDNAGILLIHGTGSLGVYGTVFKNDGTIRAEGPIVFHNAGTTPLAGSGTIILAGGAIRRPDQGQGTISVAATQKVSGTGQILVPITASAGTISSDAGGTLSVSLGTGSLANTGTLEATTAAGTVSNSILAIGDGTIVNTGGTIRAVGNTSRVSLTGVTLVGGSLATTGTAVIQVSGGTLDSATSTITSTAALDVVGDTEWKGSVSNAGGIAVRSATLRLDAGSSLGGGGAIKLAAGTLNIVGSGVLADADNAISGTGTVSGDAGASLSLASSLTADGGTMTVGVPLSLATATLSAVNGGELRLTKSPTGTGSITASGAGSSVRLQNGLTVASGASLGTTGTALFYVGSGGATLDGSADTLVSSADIVVDPSSTLGLRGAIQNGGTIFVGTGAASLAADTTLSGGGAVQLAYSSGDEGRIGGTGTLTNSNNTISGLGRIGQGMTAIVNAGTIRAVRTVQSNTLTFLAPLTNTAAGTMETNTFGRLAFDAGFVNQGTFSAYSSSAAGPVTNAAGASYSSGAGITDIKGTFTNDGTLTVPGQSSGSTPMFSTLKHGATGVQVSTAGRIVVANDFLNASTQSLTWNTSAATLVLASSQASASHRLQLAGRDLGTGGSSWTANFAWGGLEIKSGHTVSLESGRGDANAAAGYFGAVTGAAIDTATQSITNITGNGINLYYDPAVGSNAYLAGKSYALQSGGFLIPKGALGFPTAVVVAGGSGQVSLTWTAPALAGNPTVTDYRVEYSSNNGSSWTTFARPAGSPPTSTSATVTGLSNGASYRFRVAAKYAAGTSETSVPTAATVVGAPNAPAGVAAFPGNGRMTVAWTSPAQNAAAISGYVIEYKAANESGSTSGDGAATNATVFALTNGTEYVFRVAVKNSFGTGPFSGYTAAVAPTTQPVAPSPPRNVTGTAGDGQVMLGWSTPLVDGNASITDYVVQYGTNGTDWSTFTRPPESSATATSAIVTGLNNGTPYVFRVAAKNSAGTGGYSAVSAAVTPAGFPGVPLSLTATPRNGQVDLAWTAPGSDGGASIVDYVVKYIGPNGPIIVDDGVSVETSTKVLGLTNGSSYFFSVAAVNAAGLGAFGSTVMAVPRTVPTAPTAVAGTPAGGRVNLTWSQPASDGGATIVDYRIEYSSNNGSSWTLFGREPSSAPFAAVTGLIDGTSYVFRVAAINAAGNGPYSANSPAAVPKAVPGVPLDVIGTPGVGQVSLDWSEPLDLGAGPLKDYRIEFSSNGGSTWTPFKDAVSPSSAGIVTGLTNGTAYVFRVAAINDLGTGGYSPVSLPVTPRTVPGVPVAVKGVAGNKQAALSWSVPAATGGAPINDYVVEYSEDNGTNWTTFDDGASSLRSAVVTGLGNGKAYVFRVAAVNAAGQGVFTAKSATVTPRDVPDVPTVATAYPDDLGRVFLGWTAPTEPGSSPIDDYTIQYSTNGGGSWTTFPDGTSTATAATVTGLKTGTSHVFRVAAVNSLGTSLFSVASPEATPRTIPNAPTGVKATVGDGQMTIAWSAPAVNGGAAIVDYVVQHSSDGGSSWTTVADGVSSATSAVVGGLVNNAPYVFRVAAVNVAGQGAFSANSAAGTPRVLPAAPPAPTVTIGNAQATLAWTAPAASGQTIVDYAVQVSSDNGITWKDFADGRSTTPAATVKNLTNGTTYRFRVAAMTSVGTGRFSLPSLPATPRTIPGAPTAVAGSLVSGQVVLIWKAPASTGGAAIVGYVVEYSSDKGKKWTTAAGGPFPSTSAALTGLANNTSYVFRVAAVNAVGTGAFSGASAALTVP